MAQANDPKNQELADILDVAFDKFIVELEDVFVRSIASLANILSSFSQQPVPVAVPQQNQPKPQPVGEKTEKKSDAGGEVIGVLDKVASNLSGLPVIGDLIGIFQTLVPVLTALSKLPTNDKEKKSEPAKEKASGAGNKLDAAIERLIVALNTLTTAVNQLAGKAQLPRGVPVGKEAAGGGAGGAGEEAAAGIGGLAAGLAVAGVALVAVTAALDKLFSKVEGFVEKFSPATIELFHQAIDNFNATVGRAFVSVFTDLTQVIRQATGIVVPALEALAPVVKLAADAFGNYLVRFIQIAADQFRAFIPIIEIFVKVVEPLLEVLLLVQSYLSLMARAIAIVVQLFIAFSGLGVVISVLTTALKALNIAFTAITEAMNIFQVAIDFLVQSFTAFISGFLPLGDILKSFKEAVQSVIRSMYILAIQVAKFFGADGLVAALIGSIEGKLKTGDTAAQQTQILGFEQLAKNIALKSSSAGAGGDGGVQDEKQFWNQVLSDAKAAAANQKSMQEIVTGGFNDVIEAIKKLIPDPVKKASEYADQALASVPKGFTDFVPAPIQRGFERGLNALGSIFD